MIGSFDYWDIDDGEFPMDEGETQNGAKLALLENEQAWLDTYRARLNEEFADLVQEVTVYGPRARGDLRPGASFCTLILISKGDWFQKDAVGRLGHMVDMEGYFVAPVIMVYTRDEWLEREQAGSDLFRAVMRSNVRLT